MTIKKVEEQLGHETQPPGYGFVNCFNCFWGIFSLISIYNGADRRRPLGKSRAAFPTTPGWGVRKRRSLQRDQIWEGNMEMKSNHDNAGT